MTARTPLPCRQGTAELPGLPARFRRRAHRDRQGAVRLAPRAARRSAVKRVPRARYTAAAGAAAAVVLAAAGCGGSPGTLAPGSTTEVRPECTGPGAPLGTAQLRAAYQETPPPSQGLTGAVTTVAVIASSAAPHLAGDLAAYPERYELPASQLRVLSYGLPWGVSDVLTDAPECSSTPV